MQEAGGEQRANNRSAADSDVFIWPAGWWSGIDGGRGWASRAEAENKDAVRAVTAGRIDKPGKEVILGEQPCSHHAVPRG